MPPPPIPWKALQTISQVIFCAAPHNAEEMRKIPMLLNKIGFRPTASDSFPYKGESVAAPRRYALYKLHIRGNVC